MRITLVALMPALVLGAACASLSPLSQARQDLKGTWTSNDYQVAKAEEWAADKPEVSDKGITPASKTQCYSSSGSSQGIPGKRCYVFYGDKLFSRTRTFHLEGPAAVNLFEKLATELNARVFSFGHGTPTRPTTSKCLRGGTRTAEEPYWPGGKVVQLGTPAAREARDAGKLCAAGDVDGTEWIRLEPAEGGGYNVEYTQVTENMDASAEYDRHRKAAKAQLDREMRELDKDMEELGYPGTPTVTGSLDKADIRKVIGQHKGQIASCYTKALQKNPKLTGKLHLSFTIMPSGKVSQPDIKSEQLSGETEMLKCVTANMLTWQFPQPKGGGVVKVKYPFLLKTN